jgi:hypothetical protein
MTVIRPGDVFVKWHEGQHFPMRYWPNGRVRHRRKLSILLMLYNPCFMK